MRHRCASQKNLPWTSVRDSERFLHIRKPSKTEWSPLPDRDRWLCGTWQTTSCKCRSWQAFIILDHASIDPLLPWLVSRNQGGKLLAFPILNPSNVGCATMGFVLYARESFLKEKKKDEKNKKEEEKEWRECDRRRSLYAWMEAHLTINLVYTSFRRSWPWFELL